MADPNFLLGEWRRSHEEEPAASGALVFRRPSFPFPPSRGREAMTLLGDGTLARDGPGPDDRPNRSAGAWRAVEDRLELSSPGGGLNGTYAIDHLGPDRLVLRSQAKPLAGDA